MLEKRAQITPEERLEKSRAIQRILFGTEEYKRLILYLLL